MSKRRKAKMVCPVHDAKLVRSSTKFGDRYDCPADGCDVMCWAGSTSTPADQETRHARIMAHEAFDQHWRGQPSRRRHFCYVSLSRVLGIDMDHCHIGMMNRADAERVALACEYGLLIDNIVERDERHAREKEKKA